MATVKFGHASQSTVRLSVTSHLYQTFWDATCFMPVTLAKPHMSPLLKEGPHIPQHLCTPSLTLCVLTSVCLMQVQSRNVAKSHVSPSLMGAPGTPAAGKPFQLHMRCASSCTTPQRVTAESHDCCCPGLNLLYFGALQCVMLCSAVLCCWAGLCCALLCSAAKSFLCL